MKSIIRTLVIFSLVLSVSAQQNYKLAASVLSNGGMTANDSLYRISGTIGQPAIGTASDSSIIQSAGFWHEQQLLIPVELVSFTVEAVKNYIELNWTTATETNNMGFEIERKAAINLTEGGALEIWKNIGFVPGAGTTTDKNSYSFVDKNISTGKYFYRLKQIDYDGSFAYSNEVEVEFVSTPLIFELSQNYPNPFNPSTIINYQLPVASQVNLFVYDILGRKVATLVNSEWKEAGYHQYKLSAVGYSSGIYFYHLQTNSFNDVKKFVVLK